MDEKVSETKAGKDLWPSVLRNARSGRGAALGLAKKATLVDQFSEAGDFLGQKRVFSVSRDRIHRVIERTVQGLLAAYTKKPLPRDLSVKVSLIRDLPNEELNPGGVFHDLLLPLQQQHPISFANGAFIFKVVQAPDHPYATLWLMYFYENLGAIGITLPCDAPAVLSATETDHQLATDR